MSKISFWNSLKENAKRRVWVAVLSTIVLLIFYPLLFAMMMQIEAMDTINYRMERANMLFGQNFLGIGIAIVGAIICGIEGFSYLYSRQKVDVLESEPVSKTRRFFTIYTYGILVYVIPLLVAALMCIPVAQIYKVCTQDFVFTLFLSLFQCLLIFLAVYHLTILAVMLTGHFVVTLLMTGFLFLIEFAIRFLFTSMKEAFFVSYYRAASRVADTFTSPIIAGYRLVECNAHLPSSYLARQGYVIPSMDWLGIERKFFILLAVQAIVYLALAFWCYLKRPMEKNGEAMIFEKTKAPFKVIMVFFGGLLGAMIFYSMTYSNGIFTFIGMVLGLLLTQIVVEVIYDFDIKSALKHWASLCVAAVLCVCVYGTFSMDVFGYDHYVPNKSSLADVCINIEFYNDYEMNYFDEKDDRRFFTRQDIEGRLNRSNMDAVDTILKMAQRDMGRGYEEETADGRLYATVLYTKKSGRKVYRSFYINPLIGEDKEDMDALFSSKSMKDNILNLHAAGIEDLWKKSSPTYFDGFQDERIAAGDAVAMMEAYREDFDAMTWEEGLKPAICLVKIKYKAGDNYNHYASYPVYPSFKNTIAYLESKNINPNPDYDVEKIVSIDVTKYEQLYNEKGGYWIGSGSSEKTFTDTDSIHHIMENAYPSTLLQWRFMAYPWTADFNITITYDNELKQSDFSLLQDQLPKELDEEWDAEIQWDNQGYYDDTIVYE